MSGEASLWLQAGGDGILDCPSLIAVMLTITIMIVPLLRASCRVGALTRRHGHLFLCVVTSHRLRGLLRYLCSSLCTRNLEQSESLLEAVSKTG